MCINQQDQCTASSFSNMQLYKNTGSWTPQFNTWANRLQIPLPTLLWSSVFEHNNFCLTMTTTLLTASSVACELPCKAMGNISLTLELDLTKWGEKKKKKFCCSCVVHTRQELQTKIKFGKLRTSKWSYPTARLWKLRNPHWWAIACHHHPTNYRIKNTSYG